MLKQLIYENDEYVNRRRCPLPYTSCCRKSSDILEEYVSI